MKSILHIGIDLPSHSSKGLEKGFREAGFTEYNFFNWQASRYNLGIPGCRTAILRSAQSLKPDLIFAHLQNPDIFDEETAMELSKCGFTVNYSYDVRDAEKTEWMYELAPYFGLTLFACKEDVDEGRRRGLNNVGHIHSSCDTDQYRPAKVPDSIKEKYPEIVFIGNNYERTNLGFERSKEREEMVNFMKAEFRDQFGVFGMNWGPGSRIIDPVEENIIYNSAKIVVCHNNFFRKGYCSDRQWRALACGTLTFVHYYEGASDEISGPIWKQFDFLKGNCHRYLKDPFYEQVRAVQRRTFLENHTWKHRIEQIKTMIHEQRATAMPSHP